eukprot:TRINITY_DN112_c0_g2_i4.p1 TRINITY_DN112_c0_g2~~TRINITY_DN112_c0_g2_i4.p1  ORF type:complete len:1085 (+),score=406.69 TRINITY_DN112_c0_g2_i4:93-3257(+)
MAQRQSGQFSPVTASRRKSTPGFSTLSLSRGLDSNISPVQGSSPLGASPYGSPARRRQSAHPGAHDSPGSPGRAARRKSCQSVGNWMDGAPEEAGDQNVQVMLRVRPFNKRELRIHEEKSDGYLRSIIEMPDGVQAGVVHFLEKISGQDDYAVAEEFQFDKCFWSIPLEDHPYKHAFCSQETVYEHVGAPALKNAWNGFNTCIFAYGQTGAGKTHTMMGPFTFEGHSAEISGTPGVIPQLCKALYLSIEAKRKEQEESEFKVIRTKYETELSAYEIYNERVRDLFFNHTPGREPGEELKVRKHPVEGPFVDKISKLNPERWQDCLSMIVEGNEKRTVGATAMNADSSRSHSVFQIKFTQVETSVPKDKFEKPVTNRKYSIINLIDLAGSERNKKSQATGERLVEASNINLSLTTLKRVIDALVYNSQHRSAPKQVPYRDSVLTMLLSHSLGGNSKTMMVAAVSPHHDNAEETLNTLRYASAARKIVNLVRTNEDSKAKQNLLLKEQLQAMQEQLEKAQTGEGGVQDLKALDELRDQIQVGEEELKRAAEETKQVQQELRRIQEEKELEKERRYHAAFQHSFQMVVLRRQKEDAVRRAAEAQRLAESHRECSMRLDEATQELVDLRERSAKHEQQVQLYSQKLEASMQQRRAAEEQLQKRKDAELAAEYGIAWVERHRRKKDRERSLSELQAMQLKHEEERTALIDEAARQYAALSEECTDRVDRMDRRLHAQQVQIEELARRAQQAEARLAAMREEHAQAHDALSARHSLELRRRDEDHREYRSRAVVAEERLTRQLEARKRSNERVEEMLRQEVEERCAEADKAAAARAAKAEAEAAARAAQAESEAAARVQQMEAEHAEALAAAREGHERALAELTANLKAKVAEQQAALADAARREQGYRDLAKQLEDVLDETPPDASEDLRAFLATARLFKNKLVSNPINRAALERARMPPDALSVGELPCVQLLDPEVAMPLSPSRAGTPRSPGMRRMRPANSPRTGRRTPRRQSPRPGSATPRSSNARYGTPRSSAARPDSQAPPPPPLTPPTGGVAP